MNNIRIGFAVWLLLAFTLLMLPLQWIVAFILAAGFHELCHYWAVRLCGGTVYSVTLTAVGAVMEASPQSSWKAIFCALSGPAGGLLLVLLARWIPRIALCAGIHSAYNLLPMSGLDGGNALRYLLELFLSPPTCEKVCRSVESILLIWMLFWGFYGTFILQIGFLPFGIALFMILRSGKGKFPCKERRKGLQWF